MNKIIIDLIFVLIVAISSIIGYKRGIIKMLFPMIALIICVILTGIISRPVGDYIYEKTSISSNVREKVSSKIKLDIDDSSDISNTDENKALDKIHLPEVIREKIKENNNYTQYAILKVENFNDYVIEYITKLIINIMGYIISFILILIVLRVIIKLLDIVCKIPLVGGVNKLLGLVAGLIIGIIIAWIVTLFLSVAFYDVYKSGVDYKDGILELIFSNNIILKKIINN